MKVSSIIKGYPLFLLLLLLSTLCFSQTNSLQVGDKLPPPIVKIIGSNLSTAAHSNQQIASSSNHQIIILDFWATWCGACLKKMPLLDSLQQEYSTQLKIILVNSRSTGDSAEKIKEFFTKRKNPTGNLYQFTSIILDTVLRKYFPHTALPHYIWIQNNRVAAITGAQEITRENITTIISGKTLQLPLKNDFVKYNYSLPAFALNNNNRPSGAEPSAAWHTGFTTFREGLAHGFHIYTDSVSQTIRASFINISVVNMYKAAFGISKKDSCTVSWQGSVAVEQDLFCFEAALPFGLSPQQFTEQLCKGLAYFTGITATCTRQNNTYTLTLTPQFPVSIFGLTQPQNINLH